MRLILSILVASGSIWAQVAAEANRQYQTPEGRAGIAKTLDSADREQRQKPRELVALLGIKAGDTVADVGAGTGMMLPYLSEAVGPSGRVIAQDIQQDFLDRAKEKAKARNLTNVTFVLGTDRNPSLPEKQLDLIFSLDAYHHFDYPADMLGHFSRALKPGGRLAVADFYRSKRGPQDKDMKGHVRAEKDEVIREIESNGYQLLSDQDHASNQYVVIFRKK
jgi:ubiquinone/menaquinone biosynthesis C-methylase UbiE